MKKQPQDEEMTNEEMSNLLFELSNTNYWPAILRYLSLRCVYVDNVLRSEDPITNPTKVAREQGRRLGLLDLPDLIDVERVRREEKGSSETKGDNTSQKKVGD